ncbi:sugar ABC transporter substrate-binding protein [Jonesia quinghaiensis]|uniref:sugar ABC transporter substrate-binding protein n=1 Tax=Jonesia quinghaiensis TaxID=262806 RepID=UPI00040BE304|nr:maltose ABC transporter substrate-binding protein [Jonesia quinghaiensis]
MQRSIPAVAAVLGMALVLSSCSGESDSPETSDPTASEAAPSGSMVIWVDETRINDFTDVIETFKTERNVNVEVVQKASGDIRTEFIQQVPTGEGPDVIVGAHDWLGELVSNGVVAPVELGDKAAEFTEISTQAFTYEGTTYGVPYSIESIALVRNDELVSETPATFDELIEQGEDLDAKYPVLLQQGAEGDAYHMYPLQTSFGAPVFAYENGAYTAEIGMGGDAGHAFAEYLKKLGDDGIIDSNIGGDQAKEAFLAGESPYMITGPWYASEFAAEGMDISIHEIPSAGGEPAQPFTGVQGAYISAKAANPVLANDFVVNFLSTEEAADALYAAGGRQPALTASAEKVDNELTVAFGEVAAKGVPMPSLPEMGAVWGFWGATQVAIFSGQEKDAPAAWDSMISNIEEAMSGS